MKKALIIGNGMMGGSLGIALTNTGKYIVAFYDKNPKLSTVNIKCNLTDFENKEIINSFDVIFDATGNNDPLYFKVPTINIASLQYHSEHLFKDVADAFIFCHPLCGSEKSGRENARADLFENQTCIITTEEKSQELIDLATEIFNDIKMNVQLCDTVKEHNKNLAYTSHLLHYLAFNGFADLHPVLKRLSHSNKEMWEAIFQANKKNIDNAFTELTAVALVKKINDITKAIRVLVKDIPKHFYGTALKQLLDN